MPTDIAGDFSYQVIHSNGEPLAGLMAKHGGDVSMEGSSAEGSYGVKGVDSDYFSEP